MNLPEGAIEIRYDQEADAIRITLNGEAIAESDEKSPGVIVDYDEHGNVVGLEVLDASTRISNPKALNYAVTG